MGLIRGDAAAPLIAVLGVLGFSFKAILVKLAYAAYPIDALTLITLRMLYALPFFALMAWWASRDAHRAPISASDWMKLGWLGFIGYYFSSLLDFIGLQYVTASLERLVLFLYPTIVVLLSFLVFRQRISPRAVVSLALSYAGIVLVIAHDLNLPGDHAALATGSALIFASAFTYAIYLVGVGPVIARLGSLRFIAWAMLVSTACIVLQFAFTRPLAALHVPIRIHVLSFAMATLSTVLPTLLIAEAIKRMGANRASLVGSLGPIFTVGFGYLLLGEPVHLIQLAGGALVLIGVTLVTVKPERAEGAGGKRGAVG